MRKISQSSNDGFTLIESLLSFGITLIIVSCLGVFGTIKLVLRDDKIDNTLYPAISQLALTLITARNIHYGTTLEFEDGQGDGNRVFLDGDSLVKTPGYVIFAKNIDAIDFYMENNLIFLEVDARSKKQIFLVGCDYQTEETYDQIEQ